MPDEKHVAEDLRARVTQLREYARHKQECEKTTPPRGSEWVGGNFWMVPAASHVCGLSGYNPMIDPPCPGCTTPPERRLLNCTCGLADLLIDTGEP